MLVISSNQGDWLWKKQSPLQSLISTKIGIKNSVSKLDPLTPQDRPLILMYLVVPSFWRNNCWAVVDASSTRCAADLPSFQIRIKRMFKFTLLLLLFLDCQDLDAHLTYKFLLSWTNSLWVYLHTLTSIWYFPVYLQFMFSKKAKILMLTY